MEPTEHDRAPERARGARGAHAAQDAAPEPKRRGRPPGSKNKPKQDVPTEPAAPKRKPKPPVQTAPAETPEAPAEPEAPQLTREQQLHLFTVAQLRPPPPALGPRVAQLGYLAVHGLRQPAHVVQVPLPLLRLPALPQPGVEGPRLLQFLVALQQQRLQVVTGVRPAEPPEHPRLVAGFNRHHAFTLVRLRLWSAGQKRTASPACAGRPRFEQVVGYLERNEPLPGPQSHLIHHKPLLPGRFCTVQQGPQPSAPAAHASAGNSQGRLPNSRRGNGRGCAPCAEVPRRNPLC